MGDYRFMKEHIIISIINYLFFFAILSLVSSSNVDILPKCIEVQCERSSIEIQKAKFLNSSSDIKCSGCHQCTSNGFSVCIHEVKSEFISDHSCICTQSVPFSCDPQKEHLETNVFYGLYTVCYLQSLQTPPALTGMDQHSYIIVTVEPFWRNDYWKAYNLSNLVVNYEFSITNANSCDGDLIVSRKNPNEQLCRGSLNIDMYEIYSDGGEDSDYALIEEYYEDDGYSEIQFDKEVFAGTKSARFWYTIDILQPRQVDRNGKIANIETKTKSNVFEFNFDGKTEATSRLTILGTKGNEKTDVNEAPSHKGDKVKKGEVGQPTKMTVYPYIGDEKAAFSGVHHEHTVTASTREIITKTIEDAYSKTTVRTEHRNLAVNKNIGDSEQLHKSSSSMSVKSQSNEVNTYQSTKETPLSDEQESTDKNIFLASNSNGTLNKTVLLTTPDSLESDRYLSKTTSSGGKNDIETGITKEIKSILSYLSDIILGKRGLIPMIIAIATVSVVLLMLCICCVRFRSDLCPCTTSSSLQYEKTNADDVIATVEKERLC